MEKLCKPEPPKPHQAIEFAQIQVPEEHYSLFGSASEISIMSYNILADAFFKHPKKSDPNSFFTFAHRAKFVVKTIIQANPDICILQEVDNRDYYLPLFSKYGYGYSYKSRIDGPDSVVILYKKDKFSLLKSEGINFDENHPFDEDSKYTQHNVGVCIELSHLETKKKVVVLGCHFFWDPSLEQVKYLQTMICVDYLESRYKGDEIVFWGGDLNSKPNDNNINYVFSRMEPELERIEFGSSKILKDEQAIYQKYKDMNKDNYIDFVNLYSMYGAATGNNKQMFPKYTNYKSTFQATLDHIFFKSGSAVPISLLKIDEEGIEKCSELPAHRFPSDHVPIMGKFLV